ncbi:MaoC family dehydratase [Nocardia jiangxiensis]|uniref:MaoC family dehydratase n=1 Tax=Nocardia jiangxiensis TaxID=282685 RepID=UPI000593E34B|nr:MaoC family dehydratase [Nocardia jiangxiensis]
MRTFASVDEVEAALGDELGPSEALVLTQDRIDAFAAATGDDQWIHVDRERAAEGPFGTTIAHGYLTLSLIPYFGKQLFRLEFGSARINYGLDKVRFPAPVPVGSPLRAKVTFVDLRKKPAGAALTARYVLEVEGAPKPACIAESVILLS